MRTTIDIDISVLAALKARARAERKTLGAVISELAAKGLAESRDTRVELDLNVKDLGTFVDIDDKEAVERAIAGS